MEQLQLLAKKESLTLGGIPLAVSGYSLKLECPVRKHTLCSGAPLWIPLGRLPCTVTFDGQLPADLAGTLLETLRTALNHHAAIDFTFLGIEFTGMQLTAMTYQSDAHAQLTDFHLCFVGEMQTGGSL